MNTGKVVSVRRVAGRIVEWNDERGYGFVLPNGGDQKRFLHIKTFIALKQRPAIGDLVAYLPAVDERGRPTATEVKYNLAAPVEEPIKQKQSTTWRAFLGLSALTVVGVAWHWYGVPTKVAGAYASLSVISFVLYAWDKGASGAKHQRTPEATLHLWSLLGGWPGALLAQHFLRHKSRKTSFQKVFWVTVFFNIAVVAWLATSETGALMRSFSGSPL